MWKIFWNRFHLASKAVAGDWAEFQGTCLLLLGIEMVDDLVIEVVVSIREEKDVMPNRVTSCVLWAELRVLALDGRQKS